MKKPQKPSSPEPTEERARESITTRAQALLRRAAITRKRRQSAFGKRG